MRTILVLFRRPTRTRAWTGATPMCSTTTRITAIGSFFRPEETEDRSPRRGCIVLYRSQDLTTWEHYGPIYEAKHTNCPECSELYRMGDTWYLSYSRFSEFGGTIYRVSDSPFGVWRTPSHDRIGNRRFYAAKSMADATGRRFYFGWIPDRAKQRPGRMVLGRHFRGRTRGYALSKESRA